MTQTVENGDYYVECGFDLKEVQTVSNEYDVTDTLLSRFSEPPKICDHTKLSCGNAIDETS